MTVQKTEERSYEEIPNKIEKVSEELSCELNQVEWDNRAREMAEAQEKAEAEEQRKKDVTKQLNADVAVAKNKVSKYANIVATRREQRDVIVEVVYNYEKGVVTKVRTDTNETIHTREMTTTERQGGLFDYEAEQNEAADATEEEKDADV
jgi:hypothetical protein